MPEERRIPPAVPGASGTGTPATAGSGSSAGSPPAIPAGSSTGSAAAGSAAASTPAGAPAAPTGLVSPPEATIPPVLTTTLDLPVGRHPDPPGARPGTRPAVRSDIPSPAGGQTRSDVPAAAEPAAGWATGYIGMSAKELLAYARAEGLHMPLRDLLACQDYFRQVEQRNPTLTELRSLAACRAHEAFETLVQIPLCLTPDTAPVLRAYFDAPAELFTSRPAFRRTGALVALVALPATEGESLTGWPAVRALLERVTTLVEQGYVEVAASVTGDEVTSTVARLCENGGVGFAFGRDIRPDELLQNAVGGLLLELSGGDMCLSELPHQILGTTVEPGAAPDARG